MFKDNFEVNVFKINICKSQKCKDIDKPITQSNKINLHENVLNTHK